MLKKDIMC